MTMPHDYFAYGTNLNAEDWADFCRRAGHREDSLVQTQTVWLPDHRPVYHYRSRRRKGGALDVTPDSGQATPGVLFRVEADGWEALDRKEGAPRFYARQSVTVLTEDGAHHPATTYRVVPECRQSGFVPPAPGYVSIVAEGLRAFGLPTRVHTQAAVDERPETPIRHLFVYGLLQSSQALGNALNGVLHRQPAQVPGRLFDLGDSPGWQPPAAAEDWVHGELLTLGDPAAVLEQTDAIEGFYGYGTDSLYHRVLVRAQAPNAETVLAWCYRYAGQPPSHARIAEGRWLHR